MQGRTATTRHGVTRKEAQKGLGNWGKLDKLSPNTPSHGNQYIESYPKS